MRITLMDRSLYFKGLMLLIRKDGEVAEGERVLMMRIGRLFSFEKGFCQEVIDEILTNRYVVDEPPLFSEPAIARCFLKDGLKLSRADGQVQERELQWLRAIAARNHLDPSWCEVAVLGGSDPAGVGREESLEAEHFVWE